MVSGHGVQPEPVPETTSEHRRAPTELRRFKPQPGLRRVVPDACRAKLLSPRLPSPSWLTEGASKELGKIGPFMDGTVDLGTVERRRYAGRLDRQRWERAG